MTMDNLQKILDEARVALLSDDPITKTRALAAIQELSASGLRETIAQCLNKELSWSTINTITGLHMARESLFRQYHSGSPIVLIKPRQTKRTS